MSCSRPELFERFDSAELSWWMAAERAIDFPDGYLVAGAVAPAVVNSAMGSKARATAADVVPYFAAAKGGRKRRQTAEEIRNNFAAHARLKDSRV